MLANALVYAERGWYVFPLLPQSKEPLPGSHGWHDASCDTGWVREQWTAFPSANIGISTQKSGLLVLDFDWRNGGDEAWEEWGKDLETARVRTANGYHLYFVSPSFAVHSTVAPGVDVNAKGYVLAPPSVHPDGHVYAWERDKEPQPLPDWLAETVRKPEYQPREVVTGGETDDDRPGSIFNRSSTWSDILTPHGWEPVYRDGETTYWRRPGKRTGISASTNYGGLDLFYPFTSSTEFDSRRGYTRFTAFAILNHGGDFSAAASALSARARNVSVGSKFSPPPNVSGVEYNFSPAFPSDHFVSQYIDYGSRQTDAPLEYHEAAALTLLSTLTPSAKGDLAPFPGGLRTNLYTILVGPTTRSRKSTAQRIAGNLLKRISPFSRLPDRETPEAFMETLSRREGVGTLWTPDELGISIAEMYRRDFMSTLEALLLTLYAGDDFTYQRSGQGMNIHIKKPHLNILGAATPDSLARAGSTALESGLLPRFAVVYPKTLPDSRPASEVDPEVQDLTRRLESTLRAVENYTLTLDRVSFSQAALGLLNASESTLVGHGNETARLPAMLYKVAMLSALAEQRSEVTEQDAHSADIVVKRWVNGVEHLKPALYRKPADAEFEALVQRAHDLLRQRGGETPRAEIARALLVPASEMNRIEATLQDRALVHVEHQNGGTWWRSI